MMARSNEAHRHSSPESSLLPGITLLASAVLAFGAAPLVGTGLHAQSSDYWAHQRHMIQHGVQAVLTCNGLFTSNRSIEQVFDQELAYVSDPHGSPRITDDPSTGYVVDRARKAVAVGTAPGDDAPAIRAAFREGIGCVVMAPDQDFDDIQSLPRFSTEAPPGDPATLPWPQGDRIDDPSLPAGVDAAALRAASDWAFDRESEYQVTVGLLVVHDGKIVHERYAPGFDMHTRTRTWSVAKSIASSLFGIAVDRGILSLDEPLGVDFLPRVREGDRDPRSAITLRHVLNMSSGLYPVDARGMEYATGSGMSYWAGASSAEGARDRGLIREPGVYNEYENYDTLLGVYALKQALGDEEAYRTFPRTALLDRIGMRSTLIGTDRFADFILSSQVYTTPRDLARLGMLYEQDGMWEGERILPESWIDFVRTPAPSTLDRGGFYGGHFWLLPEGRNDVPSDAYAMVGNRGQYVVIVPSRDLVIVRRGLDWGRQGFSRWDLTREVLKAFE